MISHPDFYPVVSSRLKEIINNLDTDSSKKFSQDTFIKKLSKATSARSEVHCLIDVFLKSVASVISSGDGELFELINLFKDFDVKPKCMEKHQLVIETLLDLANKNSELISTKKNLGNDQFETQKEGRLFLINILNEVENVSKYFDDSIRDLKYLKRDFVNKHGIEMWVQIILPRFNTLESYLGSELMSMESIIVNLIEDLLETEKSLYNEITQASFLYGFDSSSI